MTIDIPFVQDHLVPLVILIAGYYFGRELKLPPSTNEPTTHPRKRTYSCVNCGATGSGTCSYCRSPNMGRAETCVGDS